MCVNIDKKNEEVKVEIERYVKELFEMKYGDNCGEFEEVLDEEIMKEKEEVVGILEEEW